MTRKLLLTVDYEIFGNGTGDVRQHVVDPAERMARICEKHGVPLIVFLEVEEYLAFARYRKELKRDLGYDPAALIEGQIRDFVARGHDIQLHLHPQWVGAKLESGVWKLRSEKECVDQLFDTVEKTVNYIKERKSALANLVGASDSSKIIAYRAGSFCARPGNKLLAALDQNDFVFESSVVRGLYRESADYRLDYREVVTPERMWKVRDDVASEDQKGRLWEIPIHSIKRPRFFQLTPNRLRAKFSRNVPRKRQKEMVQRFVNGKKPGGFLKTLVEPFPIKLDYHNLTTSELMRMIRSPQRVSEGERPDVLVLIGHTKEHVDDFALDRFLGAVVKDPKLELTTFPRIASLLGDSKRSLERKGRLCK